MSLHDLVAINIGFVFSTTVLLLFLCPNRRMEKNVKKLFVMLIVTEVIDCLAYNTDLYLSYFDHPTFLRVLASYVCFSTKFIFMYILLMIFLRNSDNQVAKRWLLAPVVFAMILEFPVFFTDWVYYFDANNVFIKGPLYMAPNVVAILYVFIPPLVAFQRIKNKEKWEIIILGLVLFYTAFTIFYELFLTEGIPIRETTIGVGVLSYYMFFRSQNHMDELEKKEQQREEAEERVLTKILQKTISTLSYAVDAKDSYTNGHSTRVAEYAQQIARMSGMTKQECADIYYAGLLHDIGKIAIPESIINKPDKLTKEEYELIKTHPIEGYRILSEIDEIPALADAARHHHEKYDGTGYPDGLAGEQIPEIARIIAVADAYDAMTSKRSYRDVISQEKVREEIKKNMGTQFDPHFARCMIKLIDEDYTYEMRER